MIELLSSGFYTSIQDLGRFHYTNFGVPISGAMDKNLSELANLLVGHPDTEAVIEMTLMGPKLKFKCSCIIAVTASKANVLINGKSIDINHQVSVNPDDVLEVKNIQTRAYLAVSGGLNTELKLGSRSQYKMITSFTKLNKEQIIELKDPNAAFNRKNAAIKFDMSLYNQDTMNVYPLPEYYKLSNHQKKLLQQNTFTISNESNRMAYQLNEKLENELEGITTKPVMPGTVQLTPEGKLIILMRDAQVTGGYPRIFQVSDVSFNVLSQKSAQQHINFKILDQYEIQ